MVEQDRPTPKMVRCANCGYLAARAMQSRQLLEAEEGYRFRGENPIVANGNAYEDKPVCFVWAWDLRSEIGNPPDPGRPSKRDVMLKPRECSDFTKWIEGFTPKEHVEMQLLREAHDYRDKQERDSRRWRIIELIVMGLAVTLVSAAVQIAAAFISRGTLFPPAATSQPPSDGAIVNPPLPQ